MRTTLLAYLSVLVFSFQAFAQKTKLELNYRIFIDKEPLSGTKIIISADGKTDTKTAVFKDKKAEAIFLEADKLYTLTFQKDGFASKIIEVSTIGMSTDRKKNYFYPININMMKIKKGVDYSALDKPIGKVYFDKEKKDFNDNREYAKTIMKSLEKLNQEQSK